MGDDVVSAVSRKRALPVHCEVTVLALKDYVATIRSLQSRAKIARRSDIVVELPPPTERLSPSSYLALLPENVRLYTGRCFWDCFMRVPYGDPGVTVTGPPGLNNFTVINERVRALGELYAQELYDFNTIVYYLCALKDK
jgi:hypothetical protein